MRSIYILILVGSIFLNACGGSGGGSSTDGSDGGITPPIDDGGDGITNGNASFYGFRLNGTEISDSTITPTGPNDMVLASEFYTEVHDANSRDISVAIFQPTCLDESTFEEYSAVMIGDNGNSNPTALGVMVGKAGLWVQGQSFRINTNSQKRANAGGSMTSLTGACSSGKMTLDSGNGEVYSNGKMLIYLTGSGDLYLGIRSTLLTTSSNLSYNHTIYSQRTDADCRLIGCNAGTIGAYTANQGGTLSTTVSTGTFDLAVLGTGVINLYTHDTGDNTLFQIIENAGGPYAISVIGSVGGKYVSLAALPVLFTDCVADTNNALYDFCSGSSGSIAISIED